MVFWLSRVLARPTARREPAQWIEFAARWHRAREVWSFATVESARRGLNDVADALRADPRYEIIDGVRAATVTARERRRPMPGGIIVAMLLCWLPFPDFGLNRDVLSRLREKSFSTRECESVILRESGALGDLASCVSPQTLFFACFILAPVCAAMYACVALGITKGAK
ncbi:hypothetical protein CTAYLR_003235 [Chrysophaeum taylorii]|uniref:Uncharacterized protein n=1 Tax=Chrysophaeum taylorii TaxID=2483200 RepID=A0AAD7XH32_9STRA|nr:hypothetical protein CTAYLR_003235 [Chrysophaeum taylorii]